MIHVDLQSCWYGINQHAIAQVEFVALLDCDRTLANTTFIRHNQNLFLYQGHPVTQGPFIMLQPFFGFLACFEIAAELRPDVLGFAGNDGVCERFVVLGAERRLAAASDDVIALPTS